MMVIIIMITLLMLITYKVMMMIRLLIMIMTFWHRTAPSFVCSSQLVSLSSDFAKNSMKKM